MRLLDHAVREFKKALAVCPTFVDIRTKLANTLRDSGKIRPGARRVRGACEASPDYAPARIHYGVTLWRADRIPRRESSGRTALKLDPDNRSCHVYLKMTAKAAAQAAASDDPASSESDDG